MQGTTTAANAGKEIEAAIPNIKGNASQIVEEGNLDILSGPFYSDNVIRGRGHGGGNDYYLLFDASRCSKIYKDGCKTVQPPALTVCVWKRTA